MSNTSASSTSRRRPTDLVLRASDPEMNIVVGWAKLMDPENQEMTVSQEAREALVRLPLNRVFLACVDAYRNARRARRDVVLAEDVPAE